MEIKDLLLIILPIITALISSYLTYYFAMRSRKSEAILRFKEEKYSNLLVFLQGFVGRTASAQAKRKFFEEQYRSWLYCSDDVVKAINNMVKLVITSRGREIDPNEGKKAVGNIVLAMRKDLLGRTKLNYVDFQYIDVIEKK